MLSFFYIIFLIFKVSKKKQHLLAFGYGSTTLCILRSAAITPTIVHQTSLKQILNMASKKFQQIHFLSLGTPKFNTQKMQDVSINTFCWFMSPGSSVPGVPVCPVERAGKHKTRTEPMIIGERRCLQRASRNLWWPPIFHRWDRKQNQTAIWCDMRMSQVLRDVLSEWSAHLLLQ